MNTNNTDVYWKCDIRRFYSRAGVSPAIERLTHASETPALHSEVQKQAAFGINPANPVLLSKKSALCFKLAESQNSLSAQVQRRLSPECRWSGKESMHPKFGRVRHGWFSYASRVGFWKCFPHQRCVAVARRSPFSSQELRPQVGYFPPRENPADRRRGVCCLVLFSCGVF